MRCGCGQRFTDGFPQQIGIDWDICELADGAAHEYCFAPSLLQCLVGAEPEQVVRSGTQQVARRTAVIEQGQAAHHRDRYIGQLALDQVGGSRDFVGDGDLGDLKFVTVFVFAPA